MALLPPVFYCLFTVPSRTYISIPLCNIRLQQQLFSYFHHFCCSGGALQLLLLLLFLLSSSLVVIEPLLLDWFGYRQLQGCHWSCCQQKRVYFDSFRCFVFAFAKRAVSLVSGTQVGQSNIQLSLEDLYEPQIRALVTLFEGQKVLTLSSRYGAICHYYPKILHCCPPRAHRSTPDMVFGGHISSADKRLDSWPASPLSG